MEGWSRPEAADTSVGKVFETPLDPGLGK